MMTHEKLLPFDEMGSILKGLIPLEARYNKTLMNITRRDGEKTVSEIIYPSFYLDNITKLITSANGDKNFIKQMQANNNRCLDGTKSKFCVILGSQWGDEGKGKLVDIMSFDYNVCARVAGGSNAGHTIVVGDKKYKFHLIPSGILNEKATCIVGNGVVVHLRGLMKEMAELKAAGVNPKGRLLLSDRAHIVFDFHQTVDGLNEARLAGNKLGTTKRGIGPSYGSKVMRNGLRVGDLADMKTFEDRFRRLVAYFESSYADMGLKIDVEKELAYYHSIRDVVLDMTTDSITFANDTLTGGSNILVEGANATMIDMDFGTYPYVTSSNPSVGAVCTGLGVSPHRIGEVIGIVKAYCTRVGEGPFPSEQLNATGERLRDFGFEQGTTTGRDRRCGWIDIPQLKYATLSNGFTCVNLTKVDVLDSFDEIKIGKRYILNGEEVKGMPASLTTYSAVEMEYETMPGWKQDISKTKHFEDLPLNCRNYITRIEELIGVPVRWIGVGAGRDDMIDRGAKHTLRSR